MLQKVFMALAFIACPVTATFSQTNLPTQIRQVAAEVQRASGVPAVAVVAVSSEGVMSVGAAGVRKAAEPGTRHVYSNAGYAVAAAMAERVTGRSWESLMKKYVFGPLKLRSARFGWPARQGAPAP